MRVERRRAAFKISLEKLVVGLSAANSSASVGGRTAIASFIGRATSFFERWECLVKMCPWDFPSEMEVLALVSVKGPIAFIGLPLFLLDLFQGLLHIPFAL